MVYSWNPYANTGAYPVQPQQVQQQSGGFIVVPNEAAVLNYPVAPGNCVTFKIEGQPLVYEKSMGFSQFETPKVVKYRLTREEPSPDQVQPVDPYAVFSGRIAALETKLDDVIKELKHNAE